MKRTKLYTILQTLQNSTKQSCRTLHNSTQLYTTFTNKSKSLHNLHTYIHTLHMSKNSTKLYITKSTHLYNTLRHFMKLVTALNILLFIDKLIKLNKMFTSIQQQHTTQQHCTILNKTSHKFTNLFKIVHKYTQTLYNTYNNTFAKQQSFATLYTTFPIFTDLYNTCAQYCMFYKLYKYTNIYNTTTLQSFTQLYQTLQTSDKRHETYTTLNRLYTTCQNFTTLYTT